MVKFNSTIFRTITDEATGATKSIGLFGKSYTELKNIVSSVKTNGLFKTNIVSETDLNCIIKYNTLIKGGTSHLEAIKQATVGASTATAQMIKNANGNTIALNQMTLGAKAASVAMKALSIAGNMIMSWAIAKVFQLATEAIDNCVHRVENAREKLQDTESELKSVETEIKNINSQIDELLAKDTPTITDENDLKRLRLENEELENRREILEAQKELESSKLNSAIEDKWEKQYGVQDSVIAQNKDGITQSFTGEQYLNDRIERAKELLSLNRILTDEEKQEFKDIKEYLVEQGQEIVDLTDGYVAITEEQKTQKAIWEDIISSIAEVSSSYGGTAITAYERLTEKFIGDNGIVKRQSEHREVSEWLSGLSDEDKKIMLTCDLEEVSLNDLKQYLKSQKTEIEADMDIKVDLSLEELNKQLDTIQSAYKSVQSAIEEYNTQGYISVDTFQSLMDIAPEHLQYLMDEEGNLRLGTEAMNEYTSALIDNMAMKQMQNISTYVQGLEDEERALYLAGQAAEEGAIGLMDFATAELATLIASEKLSDTEAEQITNMFENIIGWANVAKSNLFSGLGSAGSSATNDFKNSVENGIAFYKSELDAGYIDLKEYLDKSNALIDDYYEKGKISAVDYHEFKNQLLEDELDAQDKVIDAVTSHIDDIIDGIKEQQDEIQKKIDLLNDEAEAEKLAYNIEKARYDLARLQTQRTKKLYIQDKGYFYTTDNTAIREKQDELVDLERDQIIAGLEKEKDALDDSIAELEKYKEAWAEIPNLKEQAEKELYAVSILGATWEQDILNNRTDALDSFKNNYLNIQKAIADGAWHYANETNKAQASIGSGETNGGASAFVDDVEITVEKYKTGGGIKRTLQYRHNGIEGGYPDASMSKDKKLEVLEKLATEEIPLKKNEVPIIARNDELLVNTPQQNMIYHNFETMKASMQSMPMDFRAVTSGNVYNNTSGNAPNITTTIGDIHLHEIQNVHDFGYELNKYLPGISIQHNGKH